MTSLRKKTDTIAFVKQMCKEIEQPFTIYELSQRMHGKRYNYPTNRELTHILTKMDFIKTVKEKTNGTSRQFTYIGD